MAREPTTGDAAGKLAASCSTTAEIADFLTQAKAVAPHAGAGRLVFALDATMSRQPTWDMACALQAEMFKEAAPAGGLAIRLMDYRGIK